MQRNELVDLLETYDPANPERDFDCLQQQFSSSMLCFSVLATSLSTCLPALQLLLGLNFTKVVEDCLQQQSAQDLAELERWIGFIPERHLNVNKHEWFTRFAYASVENKSPKLIRKLLRLGQCKLLADTSSEQWDSVLFLQVIKTEPHANLKDSLLLAFLSSTTIPRQLLPSLLGPVANKWDWIKNIALNRACLQPNMLFSLLDAAGGDDIPVDFVEQICLVWSDNEFVLRAPLTRHAQVSGVIRYSFIHLASADISVKDRITNVVLRGVQAHLSCNITEKRILGMIVAEEFTNTLLGDVKRLEFGDDSRESFVDEYCPKIQTPLAPVKPVAPVEALPVEEVVVDENSQLTWPWPACPFSFHSNDDDDDSAEEDDDVCSLEPFDVSEDVDGLVAVPKHLGQIPDMLCSDSIDTVKCALEQFPLIVLGNAKRADTRRRAAKFIFTLLELDNKYDLVQFDSLRSKAIITLMICSPKETAPALAKAVYSRSITLGTKMVALECYAEAVKTLADGGFKEEEEIKPPPPQRPVIQVGTVIKRSNKLDAPTTQQQPRENKLAPVAWQYFFAPMCSRLVQFEREPMLLCKIIACLALVLERSKHAGGEARRMAEEFCQVLPWLKFRTEGEVQRALLYALAAVASVALELVAQDWLKWVYFVANESQDDVAREMAVRIGPMLANGVWM